MYMPYACCKRERFIYQGIIYGILIWYNVSTVWACFMIRIPNFADLTIAVAFSLTSNSQTMQKNAIKMWQIWDNISSTFIVSDICACFMIRITKYSKLHSICLQQVWPCKKCNKNILATFQCIMYLSMLYDQNS